LLKCKLKENKSTITVTTVRYQGDALTDTCSAYMEQCNQYKQSIQQLLQVYQKEDKSVLCTSDLKAATECSAAFVILR